MKPKPRITCTYLFSDGHAVQVFEKSDPDAGRLQFVVITERFTTAACEFSGRLIFGRYHEAIVQLLRTARRIRAQEPSLDAGSENTKKAGIPVGALTVYNQHGDLHWSSMPSLISAPFTYQAGAHYDEAFDPHATIWAMHPVSRIIRVPQPQPQLQPD